MATIRAFGNGLFSKCRLLNTQLTFSRTQIKPPQTLYPSLAKGYEEERPLAFESWKDVQKRLELQDKKPDGQNIGVHVKQSEVNVSEFRKQLQLNRHNKTLEQASRLGKLLIPLDQVQHDYLQEAGQLQSVQIARHYGIFDDLFNSDYFLPVVDLRVLYDFDEETVTRVYHGNKICPSEASNEPNIAYEAEEGSLWTLLMTNPDGHLTDNSKEYLHWLVTNIPGNRINNGVVLCNYLQPFPARGTGYHRQVFILFKQDKAIDDSFQRPTNCTSLQQRTFSTNDFYQKYKDVMTPVGLAFFQSAYDDSVRPIFHNVLNMREPAFEYQHPVSYRRPLTKYPHREPFNRYYDRYRDKKDLAEQVLKIALDNSSPFDGLPQRFKYPMIHKDKEYKPSWLKLQEDLMHRRLEQFKELP